MPDEALNQAFYDTWVLLSELVEDAWLRRGEDMVFGITGISAPTLNGVWSGSERLTATEAAAGLDEVAPTGLPHCLQFSTSAPDAVGRLAADRGLNRSPDIPLMRLDGAPTASPRPAAAEALFRTLDPHEGGVHGDLFARGFDAPLEMVAPLVVPAVLASPAVDVYVGEADGVAVTTGLGVRVGDSLGIFSIATPPEHRGKGYGTAMTAHIVTEGRRAGAHLAWLQSSEAGLRCYERLGFRTVDRWQCWTTV